MSALHQMDGATDLERASPLVGEGARAWAPSTWARLRRRSLPYLLVLPALIVVAITVAFPIGRALSLSLHEYILFRPNDQAFVGLENFRQALADPVFWLSLRHTVISVVVIVGAQLVIGLIGALVLDVSFRGRGLVRALVLVPWVIPSILSALMWRWMFNVNYGVINQALLRFDILPRPVGFLSDPALALASIMVVIVWTGTPFFILMLLAAMQAIPDDLYEASRVDGASAFQIVRYVTLPMIAPIIAVTSLLRIIWVANYVDVPFALTGGGPGTASLTLPVYVLLQAREALDMGFSSAMAILLALILIAVVAVYLWMLRRMEGAR